MLIKHERLRERWTLTLALFVAAFLSVLMVLGGWRYQSHGARDGWQWAHIAAGLIPDPSSQQAGHSAISVQGQIRTRAEGGVTTYTRTSLRPQSIKLGVFFPWLEQQSFDFSFEQRTRNTDTGLETPWAAVIDPDRLESLINTEIASLTAEGGPATLISELRLALQSTAPRYTMHRHSGFGDVIALLAHPLAIIFLYLGLRRLLELWVVVDRRRHRRCEACGYALEHHEPCSECGLGLDQKAKPRGPASPPS